MDSFFGRIRSGAEQAAGKAAFEADKLRRVAALQGKVRSLKGDFEKHIVETGQTAFSLFQQEQIDRPEALRQACTQLANIQAQIAAHEQQIEKIRAETFEEPQTGPQYGRVCPNGHGTIPAQDNFCQVCGAKAIEVPPQAGPLCQNCGASLSPEARFCAECGQEVKQSVPLSTLSGAACPNCGAQLLPDSAFCTECGHQAVAASPQPALADQTEEIITSAGLPEQLEEGAPPTEAEAVESTMAEVAPELPQGEGVDFEHEAEATAVSPEIEETTLNTCPVCAAPLVPDALFCTECGHRFGDKGSLS